MKAPRILPLGDAAASVEFGRVFDPALNRRVRSLDRALQEHPFPGLRESVPAHSSLLVLFDSALASLPVVQDAVERLLDAPEAPERPGTTHLIPTVYGGEHGPDLANVARARGLDEEEVIALHTAPDYVAFMLGFRPGFAYLGTLAEALEMPRLATPRAKVPAGSVAVAGPQTAVYPCPSPGGWNLIGRTSRRLFDAGAHLPAVIQAGDRVRFERMTDWLEPADGAPPALRPEGAAIEVLEGGLLTTVQDGGRPGHRRLGVPAAGALDVDALEAANAVLGNPGGAAALECTVAGPTLRFLRTVAFAVAGADLGAVLERADLGSWPVPSGARVVARAGNVLSFSGRRAGCRAYVALSGGVAVPVLLGSRSTDLTAGFGGLEGRGLRSGDVLGLGPPPERTAGIRAPRPVEGDVTTVRVVLGPQDDLLGPEAVQLLLGETYRAGELSDRVGCRLAGAALGHQGRAEIVSDGMVPGSIQVPPDGQPIVLLADGPTTGGYPKIATVVGADLPRLAQLVPGEGRVRFRAVTPASPSGP